MRLAASARSSPLWRRAMARSSRGSLIRVAPVAPAMRRAANAWDRFYRTQPAPWRGEHEVAPLLARLPDGPLLELGCGNGKMVRPLVKAGRDVVALDISWNVLRTARTNLAAQGPGRARFVLADASRLPFAPASFAAVLDVHCTAHLMEPGRRLAAADIARVLQPGGVAVVERLAPDDLRTTTGSMLEAEPMTRLVEDGRTTHFSDAADIRREYDATAMTWLDAADLRRDMRHRGKEVVRASTRAWLAKPDA